MRTILRTVWNRIKALKAPRTPIDIEEEIYEKGADFLVLEGPRMAGHPPLRFYEPLRVTLRLPKSDPRHNMPLPSTFTSAEIYVDNTIVDTSQDPVPPQQRILGVMKAGDEGIGIILEYDWSSGTGTARVYPKDDRKHAFEFMTGFLNPATRKMLERKLKFPRRS